MSMGQTVLSMIAFLGGLAACRLTGTGSPVPVEGSRPDVSAVSGAWAGRYSSKATGRHGTIRFTMPEQADTGYGEVEITFSPALRLARNASNADVVKSDPEDKLVPSPCTVLNIRFIRVQRDQVRGTLEPYWDPDCECRAHTVFEGKVSKNRITGSFRSRRESDDRRILTGEWLVERER